MFVVVHNLLLRSTEIRRVENDRKFMKGLSERHIMIKRDKRDYRYSKINDYRTRSLQYTCRYQPIPM